MKLRMFKSGKGDCLLVEAADGKLILVDGGMKDAYQAHIARHLARLHKKKQVLDVVYVSHIDQDHISGVLEMLDTKIKWRVFEHQRKKGNMNPKKPDFTEPPKVEAIWHNAFFESITRSRSVDLNLPDIASVLSRTASLASGGAGHSELLRAAQANDLLAQSVGEAIQVNRRIGAKQLNIPLNPEFDGGFMLRKAGGPEVKVGAIQVHVLGPTASHMQRLKTEWIEYLREKTAHLERLIKKQEADEDRLASTQLDSLEEMLHDQADQLALASHSVTPPNLASLMVLLEENGQTILLTGDGAADEILDGLRKRKLLDANGQIHVNVFKVPHHGAHNSYSDELVRRVTADHYLFSGDGKHHNPEPEVVKNYIRSRLGPAGFRSKHAKAENKFKLWFNCGPASTPEGLEDFWNGLRAIVAQKAEHSNHRLRFSFFSRTTNSRLIR